MRFFFPAARAVVIGIALVAVASTPAPAGPVPNGGFEDGFTDGVAIGWHGVAVAPGGAFEENSRLGPIGGGLFGAARCWDGGCEEDAATIAMSGKCHVVALGRTDMVGRLREALGDDTAIFVWLSAESWAGDKGISLLDGDIEAHGRGFADHCRHQSLNDHAWPRAYCGLTEPDVSTADAVRRVCRFEKAFTDRLHELGLKSCVLNLAAGAPAAEELFYLDEMRDLLAVADYLGYNGCAGLDETGVRADIGRETGALKWRTFARAYRERGWRFPPVVQVQAGMRAPWIQHGDRFTPEFVRDDLVEYAAAAVGGGSPAGGGPPVVGICAAVTGAWPGHPQQDHDISKYPARIIAPIGEWNRAHPVDAHDGVGAQVIVGKGSPVDRTVCAVAATSPGQRCRLQAWLRFEFYDGYGAPPGHRAEARIGVDPTGQTADPDADSVDWSGNLLGSVVRETDRYTRCSKPFTPAGDTASIWIRLTNPEPQPTVRLCIDDVAVREVSP